MTITVHNLDTGAEYTYVNMTHAEAVRNAYAQFGLKDNATWNFDSRYPTSLVSVRTHGTKRVYSLGSFSAVAALSSHERRN